MLDKWKWWLQRHKDRKEELGITCYKQLNYIQSGGVEDVQGTAKDVPTLDRHQSRPGGSEGTSKTPTRPHPGTAHPSCRNPSQNPGSSLGVGWGEQTLSYRARDTVTEDISLKPRKQEESRVNQVLSVQRKKKQKHQPRILYPAKLSFKSEGEIKIFWYK